MLRNPYQKETKKRTDRPWDDKAAVDDDPFDDAGIDWAEVGNVMEAAVLASKTAVDINSVSVSQQQRQQQQQLQQKSSNVLKGRENCEENANASTGTNVGTAVSQTTPHVSLQPTKTTVLLSSDRPIVPTKTAVQSIQLPSAALLGAHRPDAWKQSVKANIPQQIPRNQNKFNDPRQESLPSPLQFDPESVKPVQDSHRAQLVLHANLSAPLLNGWKLFPHQKRAIMAGLKMRRMILALDMGLGKTLIGCVWSKAFLKSFPDIKVLVICPVSLQAEWKRTAMAATGLTVSSKPASWLTKKENAASFDEEGQVFIASWAKVPPKIVATERYIVVADEAHSMQSLESARTRVSLSLIQASGCIGVLLLTGTPMKNGKPSNLFPLLKAVRHPLGRHQKAYEAHFCRGQEVRYGARVVWNACGSSNIAQLRALTQSHLLHLTKEDCLKDLPPQTRVFQKVPVSSRRQMQHNQAFQDLVKTHKTASKDSEAILGAIQRLRMVGSLAKIEASVQLALSVLEKEPAVVIFTSFCQVAKAVHTQLGEFGWQGEILTGETPAKKRQDLVDRFQTGISPVFVCTFGAGGVGLTLTAAHTVILVDRPWTPGEAHQAEDRVRRIGQTKAVRSLWVSAFEVDECIDRLLEDKAQTATAVLAGGAGPEPAAQRSIVQQLLQSVLVPKDGFQQQKLAL